MEYKTINYEGKDYFLVPKPVNNILAKDVEIKFDEVYTKKYFKVKVKGWYGAEKWYSFARIENENGTFKWEDWSTGNVNAKENHAILLESWYKNFINK